MVLILSLSKDEGHAPFDSHPRADRSPAERAALRGGRGPASLA